MLRVAAEENTTPRPLDQRERAIGNSWTVLTAGGATCPGPVFESGAAWESEVVTHGWQSWRTHTTAQAIPARGGLERYPSPLALLLYFCLGSAGSKAV